jgi:uncharacterized protein (TIGR03435 family)
MHRESRELPIYELSVARGGPKMTLADDQTPPVLGIPLERAPNGMPTLPRGSLGVSVGVDRRIMEDKAIPLWRMVNVLVNELGRPVVDKTNLKGLCDVRLEWAPENLQAAPENGLATAPLLTTAVQERLGLKLESTKGPSRSSLWMARRSLRRIRKTVSVL